MLLVLFEFVVSFNTSSNFYFYNGEKTNVWLSFVTVYQDGPVKCSVLFPQELALLSCRPAIVDRDSSGKLGAGWRADEEWKKYGWESIEEYMKNRWHVEHNADYVDKKAVSGGYSERFTTFDSIALSEAYLSSYYAKVSHFFPACKKTEPQARLTACHTLINLKVGAVSNQNYIVPWMNV